eukprot:9305521-Pyramimonas_sp.AAC.1
MPADGQPPAASSGDRDKDDFQREQGQRGREAPGGAPQGAIGSSSSFTSAQAFELRSILREEIKAALAVS